METSIFNKAKHLITHVHCCNSCLGRQFGNLLSGLSNKKRGEALKIILLMEWENIHRLLKKEPPKSSSLLSEDFNIGKMSIQRFFSEIQSASTHCEICQGNLYPQKLKELANSALEALNEYEFSTFLVGSQFPPSIIDKEDTIRSTYNLEFGESIKSEFNREIGKILQEQLTLATVDFKTPDIVITFNLRSDQITIKTNPLFILGRYRKFERGIPQSKWFCRECRGKGCEYCNFTGKMYQESVEEYISEPFLSAAKGTASKFHGSGREDIDARMLGTGRPFILEISEPRKRNLNLTEIMEIVNEKAGGKVEIDIEGITNRSKVRELKTRSSRNAKGYRVIISLDPPIKLEELEILAIADEFSDLLIQQRTPLRVVHRRADKIRSRKVQTFRIEKFEPHQLTAYVVCEGGLYVKELISGDEGRTQPNLSERLNTTAVVTQLDVIEVLSEKDSF
ncbi:MAG: tRNA pseudouridine(54/55) synthase Pus10 [Candidatus Heimdallarchaeota archaeon]|nr:MAG: tRNA pseudouridine(54/55) synthase Pus10 [Candidatus Heimdallarchaeota archaeon]